jgi:hypothetical protein
MQWNAANRRIVFFLLGAALMVTGLGVASFLYITADPPGDVLGYETDGGNISPVRPADSRKYLRDLELYGGKSAVLADEFRRWFTGLWRGRPLAVTVALLTVIVSFAFFSAGRRPPRQGTPDPGGAHRPNRPPS